MGLFDEDTFNKLRLLGDENVNKGFFVEAIEYYKKCVEIQPQNVIMYNRIGHIYEKLSESEYLDEQIKYFEKALSIDPDYSLTLRNLAFVYFKAERYEESFSCFHKLLSGKPLTDDYVAYGCRKIQVGDFEEGFKNYEYRFKKTYGITEYPEFDKPRWKGESLPDKTLLVQWEQGFGDSVQFFRYLALAKPFFEKIIFRVQDSLVDLFKINTNDIEIVPGSQDIKELSFDYHVPLLSLPLVLKSNIQNIPSAEGYLKADKEKTEKYRKEYFDNKCFKIGITWCGMATGNRRRDVPLKYFYNAAKLDNVKIYIIQKNFNRDELKNVFPDVEVIDLGKTFNDFSDTAAAIANLDLFLTSDNSVFNLAGAMGIPTYVLLNKFSEWRWFLDENKTPWYDSVRIFKKRIEHEKWNFVMDSAIKAIKDNFDTSNSIQYQNKRNY